MTIKTGYVVLPRSGINPDSTSRDQFSEAFIPQKAWKRFEFYSKFVVTLRFNGESPAFYYTLWSRIGQCRPPKELFPRLVDLHFRDGGSDGLSRFLLIVSPNVRRLEATISSLSGAYLGFLPARLKRLESLTWTNSDVTPDVLASHLTELHHLTFLELRNVEFTSSLAEVISRLPTLVQLTMIPSTSITEVPRFQPVTFGTLESLTLRATLVAWASLLEGRNIPETLESVRMIQSANDAPPLSKDCERFFAALSSYVPWVEVIRYEGWSGAPGTERMSSADIQSLSTCHQLRHLLIQHPAGIDVSLRDVHTMIDSWPLIRSLRLYQLPPTSEAERTKEVPISVLDDFADKCPHVEEIALPLTSAGLDVSPNTRPRLEKLRMLDVSETSMEGVETLAMYFAYRCTRQVRLHWDGVDLEDVTETELRRSTKGNVSKWRTVSTVTRALFRQRDFLDQERRMRLRPPLEEELIVLQSGPSE